MTSRKDITFIGESVDIREKIGLCETIINVFGNKGSSKQEWLIMWPVKYFTHLSIFSVSKTPQKKRKWCHFYLRS